MKSYPGLLATLGSTAAAGAWLIVWCKTCDHQVEPDPAEMAARFGAGTIWCQPAESAMMNPRAMRVPLDRVALIIIGLAGLLAGCGGSLRGNAAPDRTRATVSIVPRTSIMGASTRNAVKSPCRGARGCRCGRVRLIV